MAYDFGTLDAARAIALIAASNDVLTTLEPTARGLSTDQGIASQVRAFLAGDHWQDGDGWVGPKPSTTIGGVSDDLAMSLFAEHFVSRNMIEDIITRHTDGVVGREPAWGFTPKRPMASDEEPTQQEQDDMDAIEAALTTWWDKRKLHQLFQRITPESLLSGRAVIRLYVPASRLTDVPIPPPDTTPATAQATPPTGPQLVTDAAFNSPDGNTPAATPAPTQKGVVAATLEDALDQIFVEVVTSENATVYTDTDSMERVGIVVYYGQGEYPGTLGPRIIETTYLAGDATMARADRATVIRIVTNAQEAPVQLPLYGHLTHYAVLRPPLINASIVSIQKAINFAMSMVPRGLETAGFTERTLINAEMPGEYVDDPETGTRRLVLGN